MGDYNPNTPVIRGLEERYISGFEAPMLSGLYAVQLRTRPGAVVPNAAHLLLPTVKGAPGIGVSLINAQQPAVTQSDFYPGTDTGRSLTNVQNQAAGTLSFANINDRINAAQYARNTAALGSNSFTQALFRGNNAGALAGRRVLRVRLMTNLLNLRYLGGAVTGNAVQLPCIGKLVMGGNTYDGVWRNAAKGSAFKELTLGDWPVSPASGVPWTVTEVDNIISAAVADTFGIRWYGQADAQAVLCSAFWLRVDHCAENRIGFYYARGALRPGWDRYPNTGTLTTPGGGGLPTLSANTWYWWEVAALDASLSQFFTLAAVVPTDPPLTDPTLNTGDHRNGSVVLTSGPGGAGKPGGDTILTSDVQGAVLMEQASAVINADSQSYGDVTDDFVGTYLGVNFRSITEVTTDSSQPPGGYAGVTLSVGWWDTSQRPTRPLVVEVRHGVGAISGGGSLDATATLIPEWAGSPEVGDVFVAFDAGAVTLSNATQYFLHITSDAVAMFGQNAWRVPRDDCRSDAIASGSGTTTAMVQGATQGGTTDSYVTGGVEDDRYDVPIALVAPPSPPASVVATTYAAEQDQSGINTLPPRILLTWPASALGASFKKYRVWFQPVRLPAATPILAAEMGADAFNGLTNAQAEAQLREFWFYELGWSVLGGQFAQGWRVGVSVVNNDNGLESVIRWAAPVQNYPAATSESWLCSNAQPWLNTPLFVITREASSKPFDHMTVFEEVADRDHSVVHVPGTIPGRRYTLRWGSDTTYPDEGILAGARACFPSGRQVALLRCRGDLAYGQLGPITTDVEDVQLGAQADFVTTSGRAGPALAGPNMPCGYVLDGSSQYLATPDNSLLDPGIATYTFFVFCAPPNAITKTLVAKDDGAAGYDILSTGSNGLRFLSRARNGTLNVTDTASFDGLPHVFVGVVSATAITAYRDGAAIGSAGLASPTANESNAVEFAVGRLSGDAQYAALAPVIAAGMYPRDLSATDVTALTQYLRGFAGKKMPPLASVFYDLRDLRCYGRQGKVTDLSGNELDATITGSPLLRGRPWPLSRLEDNQ